MTDTLRDRIAAVQRNHAALTPDDLQRWQEQRCLCGHLVVGDDLEQIVSKWADHVADAVIAELGLTRVTRSERVPIHRYVTEWSDDEVQ